MCHLLHHIPKFSIGPPNKVADFALGNHGVILNEFNLSVLEEDPCVSESKTVRGIIVVDDAGVRDIPLELCIEAVFLLGAEE